MKSIFTIMNKATNAGLLLVPVLVTLIVMQTASAKDWLVTNQTEYAEAHGQLQPGDVLVMAEGEWRDFEILFDALGTKDAPIKLTAQTKGKVIISGQSNLRIAGEHLEVSGLVFKNGYTPTSAVISFRKDKKSLANYTRVTEVVIDHFNNPERFESDHWVAMYGKHNRFDHNHLEGKSNKGVTMAVRLNTPESRKNYHRIDHNYFGPRPILGSNGGETLRIGTSHYSLSGSYTTVENNYFDRCDGELEIISNKSGHNVIRGNVFFESRGTLTLRHGDDNLIEDNVFFGNGVDHTGGIRLINKRQTIRNNYMEGLAGYRFGGALVVMNGVPNSPMNRYQQVKESVIENNSLVESDHIQLAAGSDAERSAVPISTTFKNNMIFNADSHDTFTIYDDVSGITFENNRLNGVKDFKIKSGFTNDKIVMERASNGLMYPVDKDEKAGVSRTLKPVTKAEVGINWYPKSEKASKFDHGKVIKVSPGLETLTQAVKEASDGDILELNSGDYSVSRVIVLPKAITVRSASKSKEPTVSITYERGALFEIQQGGSVKLQGLKISGSESPDSSGNTVIRTVRRSMLSNYEIVLLDSEVVDLDVNHSFSFVDVSKGTFADRIEIRNSTFKNVSGAILKLDREYEDYGIYNAEYVTIKDSSFSDIGGALVDFYRGGTDESTFGPHFLLENSKISKVGHDKRNKSKASVHLHGVQVSSLSGNRFDNSPGIKVLHTVGEPVTKISQNKFMDSFEPSISELNSDKVNTATIVDNTYEKSSDQK